MNTQEQNREALIRHIADLDAVIRRRNEQIENQAHNARETQRALEEITRERDAYQYDARAAELALSCARAAAVLPIVEAAEARPLTPDAITDEMVDRAHRSLISHHGYGRILRSQVCEALTAALTEPPARPEGAERFDPVVDAAIRGYSDITSPDVVRAISDAIAEDLIDPARKEA